MSNYIFPEFIKSHVVIGFQRSSNENILKKETEFPGVEQYLYLCDSGYPDDKLNPDMISEDLWDQAKANTFAKTIILSMSNIYGVDDELPLYVVTNESFNRGAANVLDRKALTNYFGHGTFIVVPSSIHEVLILSADEFRDLSDLDWLINDVNREEVLPEEQLGDRAYQITL